MIPRQSGGTAIVGKTGLLGVSLSAFASESRFIEIVVPFPPALHFNDLAKRSVLVPDFYVRFFKKEEMR